MIQHVRIAPKSFSHGGKTVPDWEDTVKGVAVEAVLMLNRCGLGINNIHV